MKVETLKERVFAYGLDSKYEYGIISFIDIYDKNIVAMIDEERMYGIYLYNKFYDLPAESQKELYEIFYKYAKTPPGERANRYYLRHKWLGEDDSNYLNLVNNYAFEICTKKEIDKYKTQFTAEEIKAIKKKYNTDLKEFEIVEVEE